MDEFYRETDFKETEIGRIPKDWDVVKLHEVGEIFTGKTPPTSNSKYWNGEIPFITPGDMDEEKKYVRYTKRYVTLEGAEYVGRILPKNSILVVCIGSTIGKTAMTSQESVTNQQINSILPRNGNDPHFIYYAVSHRSKVLRSMAGAAAVPIIRKTLFETLQIPLPPLEEQKKIAEILSTVDKAVETVDQAIKQAERLKKGLVQELLTNGIEHKEFKETEIGRIPKEWKVVKIRELFIVETGTTPSTKVREYWEKGEVEWYTPTDLSKLNGRIFIKESERKITKKAVRDAHLSVIPKGSILISTRAPVGYVAILQKEGAFSQGCKGLVPKGEQEIFTPFYAYYLLSRRSLLESLSGGSTFRELSKKSLEDLAVPLPPLEEQKKIAEILSTVDEVIGIKRRKKEKLRKMKKSLMDFLLTGKVRVRV